MSAAIGLRYRLLGSQGGGCVVGPGTPDELLTDLRGRYGARLLWVEMPDGQVVRFENGMVVTSVAGGGGSTPRPGHQRR